MEEIMSIQAAKDFIEKAKTDVSIQKELHERTRHPVDIAKAHGYDCTVDDYEQAMQERTRDASSEVAWCSNR
jgi:predicted ribosomally synthesized peptide with nif11-like leader